MMQKTAVITGAAGGIGRILVRDFLKDGYCVIAADVNGEGLDELKKNLLEFSLLRTVICDVSDENDAVRLKEFALGEFDRTDCLVNNAAVSRNVPVESLPLSDWNHVIAVNLTGPFLTAKHFASELKKNRGTIINIASTRSVMSEAGTEAYSASKGGLLSLTHALSMSLAPVRVNSISPGWIHISGDVLSEEDHSQHPAGRVGVPEDVSGLALYLASDKSGFVTGQNFIVDGGMTKKMIYK